jgi:hypothetical protein
MVVPVGHARVPECILSYTGLTRLGVRLKLLDVFAGSARFLLGVTVQDCDIERAVRADQKRSNDDIDCQPLDGLRADCHRHGGAHHHDQGVDQSEDRHSAETGRAYVRSVDTSDDPRSDEGSNAQPEGRAKVTARRPVDDSLYNEERRDRGT